MKPDFEVPGSVAADMILLRTDEVAVALGLLRAYTTGFEFVVDTRARRAGQRHRIGGMRRHFALPGDDDEGGPRLGLEYSDGRRTEIGPQSRSPDDAAPDALFVRPGSGGGSGRSWHSRFWAYPLPPPGPVSFVATWPEFGIAEARAEIEAETILEAAARAIVDQALAVRSEHNLTVVLAALVA